MKKIIAWLLSLLIVFSLVACAKPATEMGFSDPAAAAMTWIKEQMENNTLFSFDYNGVEYAKHITQWDKVVEETQNGWILTYKNGDVTAWSEIIYDSEMAALEWTNYFKNEGSGKSPVISNIQAINAAVTIKDPIMTSAKGSIPDITDFQRFSVDLTKESEYSMASGEGRSSDLIMPYFDICNGEYGVIGGIGWSGDWKATFSNEDGRVTITAGMKQTNIALLAGEDMRTPMMALQFFVGDQDDGHNDFRQLVLKSYTPADESGHPIKYGPIVWTSDSQGGLGLENELQAVRSRVEGNIKFDVHWIDAGWYGDKLGNNLSDGSWYNNVGNWYFIPDGYPDGNIKPVSDYLHEHGKELLLWVEPERAIEGTKLTVEHPEYFYDKKETSDFMLLKLSENEVLEYMVDWIGGLLRENGVDWYRQDFNMKPTTYWSAEDRKLGEDRVGITEIQYITNEYRFLDALVEMNPGLMIDNCASGGKRLDLEMMSRSIPLWRTDYTSSGSTKEDSTAEGVRTIGANLSWWLPISDGSYSPNGSPSGNLYNYRCSTMNLAIHARTGTNLFIDEYLLRREIMRGDYYILKQGYNDENSREDNISNTDACYEYYLEDEGRGFLAVFRPNGCDVKKMTYLLKGLDENATYNLSVNFTDYTLTMTGKKLMEDGLSVDFFKDGDLSYVIFFEKVA